VLLRPIGNVVYFMPPYVVTPDDIRFMVQVGFEAIVAATAEQAGSTASDMLAIP
jgi:adenosylmethionine-8-amino-7-oxononanoate aminotransferase